MTSFASFLLIYLLGGLTFIPIILAVIFYHAHVTQPVVDPDTFFQREVLDLSKAEKDAAAEELENLPEEISRRVHEPDVAAGYFAVSREYTPAAVNGKPVEKPASNAAAASGSSPSVYQSMYRSIFARGSPQSPSLEATPKGNRRISNIFYVVIRFAQTRLLTEGKANFHFRHGTLMLYDDIEQLEVRHVISLSYYDIDVYGGGESIPEGELWVKRNCIRMAPRTEKDIVPSDAKPYYLFSTNCSEKEDFFHAMLLNQGRDGDKVPAALAFNDQHMEKLIRQLHASKAHFDTRWFNALIGRVFLSMYKTSFVEQLVRKKINKKLVRVAKPAFITALQIKNIDLGDSPPLFTLPKLKEFSKAGDLTVEADVSYNGNARIDIAAIARIDLGPRFKTREVQLLLAAVLKNLEGHVYFRVKPPPSNRIWFSFETMPKMDISVEPVVSSRQITYGLVLRAIESRLREVIAETIVQPNWDDIPFFDTEEHPVRGGLWQDDSAAAKSARLSTATTLVEGSEDIILEEEIATEGTENLVHEEPVETVANAVAALSQRKSRRSSSTKTAKSDDLGVTSGAEVLQPTTPRAFRSKSFVTAATPVVSQDQAVMEALSNVSAHKRPDAATTFKDIALRSQTTTPTESPVGSPGNSFMDRLQDRSTPSMHRRLTGDRERPSEVLSRQTDAEPFTEASIKTPKDSDNASILTESSSSTHKSIPSSIKEKRQSLVSGAATAKKWGLEFINRHSTSSSMSSINNPSQADISVDDRPTSSGTTTANFPTTLRRDPMGRGQPLPPPGTPLPGPPKTNRMTWSGPLGILNRKNGGSDSKLGSVSSLNLSSQQPADPPRTQSLEGVENTPPLPPRAENPISSSNVEDFGRGSAIPRTGQTPKLPSRRRNKLSNGHSHDHGLGQLVDDGGVLIIKAPEVDGDTDSVASSFPSDGGELLQRVLNLGITGTDNDLQDEPMGDMEGIVDEPKLSASPVQHHDDAQTSQLTDEQSEKSMTYEPSSSPIPHSSPLSPPSTTNSFKSHVPAPINTTIPDVDATEALSPGSSTGSFAVSSTLDSKPRRIKSRHSLIPTPTSGTPSSSRKHSPSARMLNDVGRRSSMQDLLSRMSSPDAGIE